MGTGRLGCHILAGVMLFIVPVSVGAFVVILIGRLLLEAFVDCAVGRQERAYARECAEHNRRLMAEYEERQRREREEMARLEDERIRRETEYARRRAAFYARNPDTCEEPDFDCWNIHP